MQRWAGFAEATGGQTDRQSDRRTVAPHTVTMTVLTVETQGLLGNIMAGGSAACLTAAAPCVFRLAACLSPVPSRQRGPSARAGRPGAWGGVPRRPQMCGSPAALPEEMGEEVSCDKLQRGVWRKLADCLSECSRGGCIGVLRHSHSHSIDRPHLVLVDSGICVCVCVSVCLLQLYFIRLKSCCIRGLLDRAASYLCPYLLASHLLEECHPSPLCV